MIPLPLDLVRTFEERLEKAWTHRAWCKARDSLMISFGLCGLRWNEVANMKVGDIDQQSGTLLVRTAKGGIKRTLPVGVHILCAVRCLFLRQRPSGNAKRLGLVFYTRPGEMIAYENMARRMKAWTPIVFGKRYSFHCLRHTAAIRVYKETGDVLAVQKFLGHCSLKWTETYLRTMTFSEFKGMPTFCQQTTFKLRLFDPDNKHGSDPGPTSTPPAGRIAA